MTSQTDETRIELISKDISYMRTDIQEIKLSLRDAYATKKDLSDTAILVEARLIRLEKSSSFLKWMSPTAAAVMGSLLTFLIINFLNNLG